MILSAHKKAVIALIIANFIWGAAAPIFKWSLESIQPFTLAFLRFSLAAFILLPFAWHKLDIKRADFTTIFLISFFGITINIGFFFFGLTMSSSINAPIIHSASPVFIIIGSLLFLHEKLKLKVLLGTIVSLIGVLLIILRPIIENGFDGSIIGNLFFMLAALGTVIHTLLLRKIAKTYDPITITYWTFLIGAISFFPMFYSDMQHTGLQGILNHKALIGIIFGAIFSSAIAYYLYNYALKFMIASEVGLFVYLDPIIAILIAVPLLGETLTTVFVLGSFLVFLGIFIAEGRIPYHPLHRFNNGHKLI